MIKQRPVCEYDERPRIAIICSVFSLILIWAGPVLIIQSGTPFITTQGFWGSIALAAFPIGIAVYVWLTTRRVEFYEDFVTVYLRRGETREVPYPQLNVRWEFNNRGTLFAQLSVKGEVGKPEWPVRNIKVRGQNIRLYKWLNQKVGQEPDINALLHHQPG